MIQNYGKAKVIPKPKKFIEKGVPSLTINQIENSKGYVELKMDPAIRKMSRELTKMDQNLMPLLNQANDITKDIGIYMQKTAESLTRLGQTTQAIQKSYKVVADKFDFDSLSTIEQIYGELSNNFTLCGKNLMAERQSFYTNIESLFSFEICEIEGIDEVG